MKKFKNMLMKARWVVPALFAVVVPTAFGQESTSTVPAAVTDAIGDLQDAADAYAAEILPYIVKVGLAFVGIAIIYMLFRLWKRFASGR